MTSVVEPSFVDAGGAIARLAAHGYQGRFTATCDGLLCCEVCGLCHEPDTARVGELNLDDGSVVFAVRCPCCQHQGTARMELDDLS